MRCVTPLQKIAHNDWQLNSWLHLQVKRHFCWKCCTWSRCHPDEILPRMDETCKFRLSDWSDCWSVYLCTLVILNSWLHLQVKRHFGWKWKWKCWAILGGASQITSRNLARAQKLSPWFWCKFLISTFQWNGYDNNWGDSVTKMSRAQNDLWGPSETLCKEWGGTTTLPKFFRKEFVNLAPARQ